MSKKVYFARSIDLYDCETDKHYIGQLNDLGLDVVDPNVFFEKSIYEEKGMSYFLEKIDYCDLLVFCTNKNRDITAGVAKEIQHAYDIGIPVFEFPSDFWDRSLNVDETREYLKEIGER